MAFSRKANSDEFLVVSSFNKGDLSNYRLPTDGRWERVLSSDDVRFGGEDKFAPRVLDGNNGTVDLAAGATVVFKRVD
jgi:1,4-alpha-glucan branching enzyme